MWCGGSSETATTRFAAATLTLLLSACSTAVPTESPAYQAGFADGCATASAEGSGVLRAPQRNEALYEGDPGYRAGWISGHATCRMPSGPPRL
jgi:hypothetical protein